MLRQEAARIPFDPGQILTACFGDGDDSRRAYRACLAFEPGEIATATGRLLPFVYRRWGASDRNGLIEAAHRAYLATWQRNRERMAQAAAVLGEFERAGIECMLLKGAALTLRNYRDYGLRGMGDFDLLIHRGDLDRAAGLLLRNGWRAEEGRSLEAIQRHSRVGHACQFSRSGGQNCDLHWHPLIRCYSPQVAEMFWRAAETVDLAGHAVKVPCQTDQLLHVCVHGLHWERPPNLYWMADAITVLRGGELDWDRAAALATRSNMRALFAHALLVLAARFRIAVPGKIFDLDAPAWELREYALMQKPCPLNLSDRLAWHRYHFRRLRPFDRQWSEAPFWLGFPQYLSTFRDTAAWRSFAARLWLKLKARSRAPGGKA